MELALKTAKGKRDQAAQRADEAEELLRKKKIEMEDLKKEMKNNV